MADAFTAAVRRLGLAAPLGLAVFLLACGGAGQGSTETSPALPPPTPQPDSLSFSDASIPIQQQGEQQGQGITITSVNGFSGTATGPVYASQRTERLAARAFCGGRRPNPVFYGRGIHCRGRRNRHHTRDSNKRLDNALQELFSRCKRGRPVLFDCIAAKSFTRAGHDDQYRHHPSEQLYDPSRTSS